MSVLTPGPLDCSWAEIADLLAATRTGAWQRFATRATAVSATRDDRSGSEPPPA